MTGVQTCALPISCKNNKFLCLELFEDEIYREGHQKSLDCWDICKDCVEKLQKKPFLKKLITKSKTQGGQKWPLV